MNAILEIGRPHMCPIRKSSECVNQPSFVAIFPRSNRSCSPLRDILQRANHTNQPLQISSNLHCHIKVPCYDFFFESVFMPDSTLFKDSSRLNDKRARKNFEVIVALFYYTHHMITKYELVIYMNLIIHIPDIH